MICNPCAGISSDSKKLVAKLKKEYDSGISDHYVFRLKTGEKVSFVRKKYFNLVFEDKIKPNFKNGAEFWHISEFQYK